LLISIVLWTFFAEATSAATSSIAGNGHLLRKAAFPRIVLVIASTLTPLISFIINITLIVAVTWLIGHLHPGVRSLVVPLLLFEFYLLIIGVGLILASLFVFYRDIGHLWEIFSQLLFYGSAIVFPFKLLISHGHLARLVSVNPLAQIVEDMRRALVIADPDVPWTLWVDGMPLFVVPLMLVAVLLAIGILTFRRLSPRFAESL